MKLVKTANGKTTVKMSKNEWEALGKKAGWMKVAQNEAAFLSQMKQQFGNPPWDDATAQQILALGKQAGLDDVELLVKSRETGMWSTSKSNKITLQAKKEKWMKEAKDEVHPAVERRGLEELIESLEQKVEKGTASEKDREDLDKWRARLKEVNKKLD